MLALVAVGIVATAKAKHSEITGNTYSYVNGNPVNMVDPTGHETRCQREGTSCEKQAAEDRAAVARQVARERRTKEVNTAWTRTMQSVDKVYGTPWATEHRALLRRGDQDELNKFRTLFVELRPAMNKDCAKSWWCSAIADPDVQAAGASAGIPIELVGAKLVLAARARLAAGAAAKAVDIGAAKFAQRSFSETFSKGGLFSGRTIDDVAEALRSGAMSPKDIPINVVVRDGTTLITNTRSAQALTRAKISRDSWNVINRTGEDLYENLLSGQLSRNGLTSAGTNLP